MAEPVLIPGGRDVRGSLDRADSERNISTPVVIACPPHPQHSGTRSDNRLCAVSDKLTEHGIDCIRFDYGEWDNGYGEREDAQNAIRWATKHYDRVGIFGYSFGGTIALLAAAKSNHQLDGISVFSPVAQLNEDFNAADSLLAIDAPIQLIYGKCDTIIDPQPIVDQANKLDHEIIELDTDHLFINCLNKASTLSSDFLVRKLV